MFNVAIDKDGAIRFIHTDDLHSFLDLGEAVINRVSYVEPRDKYWYADLAPVGGPVLGPFELRADALAAEIRWLKSNLNL